MPPPRVTADMIDDHRCHLDSALTGRPAACPLCRGRQLAAACEAAVTTLDDLVLAPTYEPPAVRQARVDTLVDALNGKERRLRDLVVNMYVLGAEVTDIAQAVPELSVPRVRDILIAGRSYSLTPQ